MATIDQQFVEYIVKTLVNNPDKVAVDRVIDEKGVLLTLTVDPDDVGRVIGRRGVTAQAIRVLLRALGTKQDARYNLKIVNTDEDGETRRETKDEAPVVEETEEVEEVAEARRVHGPTPLRLRDIGVLDLAGSSCHGAVHTLWPTRNRTPSLSAASAPRSAGT